MLNHIGSVFYCRILWIIETQQANACSKFNKIALLKQATNSTFLISTGTVSQILGDRWHSFSEPKVTDSIAVEWNVLLSHVLQVIFSLNGKTLIISGKLCHYFIISFIISFSVCGEKSKVSFITFSLSSLWS